MLCGPLLDPDGSVTTAKNRARVCSTNTQNTSIHGLAGLKMPWKPRQRLIYINSLRTNSVGLNHSGSSNYFLCGKNIYLEYSSSPTSHCRGLLLHYEIGNASLKVQPARRGKTRLTTNSKIAHVAANNVAIILSMSLTAASCSKAGTTIICAPTIWFCFQPKPPASP